MATVERDARYIRDFLARVARTWHESPDTRFGQFCCSVETDVPLSRISDEEFRAALDRRDEWLEAARHEAESRAKEPVAPWIREGARRTNEEYRAWALRTFGRVGRDPARIEPFLARLGEAWAERPQMRFGELVASTVPSGLSLVEEDVFLRLLEHPGSIGPDEIEAAYVYRGPLGDLLREIESHGESQS